MSARTTALGLALLAVMAGPVPAEDQPSGSTDAPQWTEFKSPEHGFAVSFPGSPKATTAPVEGQNPLLQYDFLVSLGDDTVYGVTVFEYPTGKGPSPDNDTYVKLVSAYAKGTESRLRKRGAATVAGYPGFEAISDDAKGKLSHLIDIVPSGDRLYMLVTAGPKNHATNDDAERFRDSFRLLGEGGTPQAEPTATPPPQ